MSPTFAFGAPGAQGAQARLTTRRPVTRSKRLAISPAPGPGTPTAKSANREKSPKLAFGPDETGSPVNLGRRFRPSARFWGGYERIPKTEDCLERGEFELAVSICKQSDDSIRLSFAKLMTCFLPGYNNNDRIGSAGSDQVRHTCSKRPATPLFRNGSADTSPCPQCRH
jgi:hypothetical protein